MSAATDGLQAEVTQMLAAWRIRFAGRPDLERHELLLLALEREQFVTIAYRESALIQRIDSLPVGPDLQALIRQALVWIWKDEELHSTVLRGLLLKSRRPVATGIVLGHQLIGAASGWVTSTRQQRRPGSPRLRGAAADILIGAGRLAGRITPELADELRYRSFRRYCELNVALERTAELAYERLVDIAPDPDEHALFDHIRLDEHHHGDAFRALAAALDDDDHLVPGQSVESLGSSLASVSTWLVPARMRHNETARRSAFTTTAPVFVADGAVDELDACLWRILDGAGIGRQVVGGPGRVAVRTSFMLGYDRRDRSNVVSPALLDGLARYLRCHGATDVAVLEAPTVYGRYFNGRSVPEVAEYFGYDSAHYRIVDVGTDQRPFPYQRGLLQSTMSATWWDADVRLVAAKLRTDPNEFGHLCLCTLEGMASQIDETVYTQRQLDFRTSTMMLLDAAPPDGAIVDAWGPIADGPVGVMGCRRPAHARRVYAGSDTFAVDRAVLADMGLADALRAPILRRAFHWFGIDAEPLDVRGGSGPLPAGFRDPWSRRRWRALAIASYPVYANFSGEGKAFVPAMDLEAFPSRDAVSPLLGAVRRATQGALGLSAGRVRTKR
ncbi:MAG: DUF362 domain-containing protein [Acidimicrobiales bacterium]